MQNQLYLGDFYLRVQGVVPQMTHCLMGNMHMQPHSLFQSGCVGTTQFELYSSRVAEFEVYGRQNHPRSDGPDYARGLNSSAWQLLGRFTAANTKGTQVALACSFFTQPANPCTDRCSACHARTCAFSVPLQQLSVCKSFHCWQRGGCQGPRCGMSLLRQLNSSACHRDI